MTLHDLPHVPEQSLPEEHSSEQLSDVPHALEVKLQCVPAEQLQLVPEHDGGTPASPTPPTVLLLPLHASAKNAKSHTNRTVISSSPGILD